MENIKKIYAGNVRKLRKSLGHTQETFSETSGISISFLKDIEGEKSIGSASTLELLSKALGVPVYRLFMSEKDVARDESLELMSKIVSLGPEEMGILKDTLDALTKPLPIKTQKKKEA